MRVLVWQQYGNAKVFVAQTPEHFMKIFDELSAAVENWDLDVELETLFESMRKSKTALQCEQHFTDFVRPHYCTHENFEQFQFVNVQLMT